MRDDIILKLGGGSSPGSANTTELQPEKATGAKFEQHFASAFKTQSTAEIETEGKQSPEKGPNIATSGGPTHTHREFLRGGRTVIVSGDAPTEENVKVFAESQGLDPKSLLELVVAPEGQPSAETNEDMVAASDKINKKTSVKPRDDIVAYSDSVRHARLITPKREFTLDEGSDGNSEVSNYADLRFDVNRLSQVEADIHTNKDKGTTEKAKSATKIALYSNAPNPSPVIDQSMKLKNPEQKPLLATFPPQSYGNEKVVVNREAFSKFIKPSDKITVATVASDDVPQHSTSSSNPLAKSARQIKNQLVESAGLAKNQVKKIELGRSLEHLMKAKAQTETVKRDSPSHILKLAPIDLGSVIRHLPEEMAPSSTKMLTSSALTDALPDSNATFRALNLKESPQLNDGNGIKFSDSREIESSKEASEGFRRPAEFEPMARKLTEILGQRLLAQISKGAWKVEMELYPKSLGRVEVQLEMVNGRLEAHFHTNQALTRELLAEGIPRLKESLEQHGMESASIDVELGNHRQNDKNQTTGEQKGNLGANTKVADELQTGDKTRPVSIDGRFDFFV